MNGGINAIRGYLFQYLICILDSFQDDWSSVIIEPSTAEDKVDILWFFEIDGRAYKKAVQVKSTQNQFGKPEAISIAHDLKNKFKDADFYELVLIGHASSTLLEYLRESEKQGVSIPHPKVWDLEAFKGNACHKIDKYLEENYNTQVPWYQLEELVFGLIGELQYYSTNKREVTRDEFENRLLSWVKSYVNFVDYELQDSKNFRRLYGFDASPSLRMAINKFFKKSRKIRKTFFKECQNFLDVDINSKTLKIIYPRADKMFFYFGSLIQVMAAIPMLALLLLACYVHWKFILILVIYFPLLLMPTSFIRPYYLAKKIDKELKELHRRK